MYERCSNRYGLTIITSIKICPFEEICLRLVSKLRFEVATLFLRVFHRRASRRISFGYIETRKYRDYERVDAFSCIYRDCVEYDRHKPRNNRTKVRGEKKWNVVFATFLCERWDRCIGSPIIIFHDIPAIPFVQFYCSNEEALVPFPPIF